MMERNIIIASITSTAFLKECREVMKPQFIQASTARLLLTWCLEYFDEHGKAPGPTIEDIYFEKLKEGKIQKDVADELEQDILPEMSKEYENAGGIDLEYLIPKARKYFAEQSLLNLNRSMKALLNKGNVEEAEELVNQHRATTTEEKADGVILNQEGVKERVIHSLSKTYEPLIVYPGALGKFWNHQMVRGGFVAFLSPEKRGKSAITLDACNRASVGGKKVALFNAGDMSTDQQLRREAIYLTKTPVDVRYTGTQYVAVPDCIRNQLNQCDKDVRECYEGILEHKGWDETRLRAEVTYKDIYEAMDGNTHYAPCHNCKEWQERAGLGTVCLKKMEIKNTLDFDEAGKVVEDFFVRKQRDFRMVSYPNGTLTVKEMKRVLEQWKDEDGWVPDVLALDYADLVEDFSQNETRHKQNAVWRDLRGLNQELDCLFITSTQSDSGAYDSDTLSLKNFSEDKRKFAHCTAFYGLNQDRHGREKKMGILRINELLLREGDFDTNRHCYIVQQMMLGRPIVASYF